jgi:3'-5' exoribonuclease
MSEARTPRPFEWVGSAQYPWPPTSVYKHGQLITACYGVLYVEPHNDGSLHLTLADARERVDASLEDGRFADWIRAGVYVGVRGVFDAAHESLIIHEIVPVRVTLDDLPLFLPGPNRDPREMEAELQGAIASVTEPGFRALLSALLATESEAGQGFRLAPAATRNHHAHLGGLLEHTLSVTGICHHLAAHYGERIDRNLLITGALLHDIGKVREIGAQAGFAYTDEGRLLGHILLGLRMVREGAIGLDVPESRLLLLEHVIASHQGRYEWQSPREPRTLEALLLHYADDLDAKFDPARTAVDSVENGWTDRDPVQHREWLRHRILPAAARATPVTDSASGKASSGAAGANSEDGTQPSGNPRGHVAARKAGAKSRGGKSKRKKAARKGAANRSGNKKSGSPKSARGSDPRPHTKTARTGFARAPRASDSESLGRNDPGHLATIPLDPHTLDMFG